MLTQKTSLTTTQCTPMSALLVVHLIALAMALRQATSRQSVLSSKQVDKFLLGPPLNQSMGLVITTPTLQSGPPEAAAQPHCRDPLRPLQLQRCRSVPLKVDGFRQAICLWISVKSLLEPLRPVESEFATPEGPCWRSPRASPQASPSVPKTPILFTNHNKSMSMSAPMPPCFSLLTLEVRMSQTRASRAVGHLTLTISPLVFMLSTLRLLSSRRRLDLPTRLATPSTHILAATPTPNPADILSQAQCMLMLTTMLVGVRPSAMERIISSRAQNIKPNVIAGTPLLQTCTRRMRLCATLLAAVMLHRAVVALVNISTSTTMLPDIPRVVAPLHLAVAEVPHPAVLSLSNLLACFRMLVVILKLHRDGHLVGFRTPRVLLARRSLSSRVRRPAKLTRTWVWSIQVSAIAATLWVQALSLPLV